LLLKGVLIAALVIIAGAAFWLYAPDRDRAALEREYGVKPGDYVTVAGIRLHVVDQGPRDAPAIILLHGFGSSLQTWDAWAAALAKTHRVIRFDLPGFGLTGPDPTGDYSDARAMRIIVALMDQLGLAKASVIGNSLGGRLAWMFAADHPDRVDKLVLVSPDGFASPGFEYGRAPDVPLMMRALPYVMPRAMLRASLAPAYADPAHLTEPTLTRYSDMMRAPGVRGAILDRMRQSILQDPEPLLRRIQAATLLLWGRRDGMIPFANSTDYLRDLPHATLVELPDLGHVPFEEAPAESLPPVQNFLDAK
jgi:pimeloyl-ACP methyl ester carboxylesterase